MKRLMILSGALAALAVCADKVPVVSGITMTQGSGSRLVTITYTLANAAAVVTLDIQTNSTAGTWASIGGENIQNVSGDVWKKVEAGGHTISWRPDLSWPGHEIANSGARAVVTAWSVDNPPDYMVVDLSRSARPNTECYYPSAAFLPGGLLSNDIYRTTHLVMRKISAKGVTWTMGSDASEEGYVSWDNSELSHAVTLTNNYYMGVFTVTQSQWANIQTSNPTPAKYQVEGSMRPVEQVCFNEIRNNADCSTTAGGSAYDWPNPPNEKSFLGLLRTRTGLAFDLPSEAQWEFACRAGHGIGYWNDGSPIHLQTATVKGGSRKIDENLYRLGRYSANGGLLENGEWPGKSVGIDYGTSKVGSYAPNSWGLYDMNGNVMEWCLDWYQANISTLEGKLNIDPATPANLLDGTAGVKRVVRNGFYTADADTFRSARRAGYSPSERHQDSGFIGFRLCLPLGE